MRKMLILLALVALIAGCSTNKATTIEGMRLDGELTPVITSKLAIVYATIGGPNQLDTRLEIGHDGSLKLSEKGRVTKRGSLNQAELQRIVNAFYDYEFYKIPESYLATQVVEGVSRTLHLKDDNGAKMVSFYEKGSPPEFMKISRVIEDVAFPKLK